MMDIRFKSSILAAALFAAASATASTRFEVPAGVWTIAPRAFAGCAKLTDISIPSSVMTIGTNAFYRCDSLTNISVDADNNAFRSQDGVLYSGNGLTLLCCPGGKTGAFTIPEGTRYIANRAFAGCRKLTEVTLPTSLMRLGTNVFYRCSSLTNIAVAAGSTGYTSTDGVLFVASIQPVLVACPPGKAGTYAVPAGTWRIADRAFAHCDKLTEITLPANAFTLGADVFYQCASLTNIAVTGGSSLYASTNGALYSCSPVVTLVCCPGGMGAADYVTVNDVDVPYAWLESYGLVASGGDYAAAAVADVDGDGYAAWQEYLAGTDPTNAASRLLASISFADGAPVIAWNVTNHLATYTVLGATNLTDDFTASTNAADRFFKVRLEQK